jgi:lysozyme family protein
MEIQSVVVVMSKRFYKFIPHTFLNETGGRKYGGYTNDPADSGGETKWGISKAAHPDLDIRSLSKSQASNIYKSQYYNKAYDEIASDSLAFKLFDMGVLMGPKKAVQILQKTVNTFTSDTLIVDGAFGPRTLSRLNKALNLFGYEEVLVKYKKKLSNRLRLITWLKPKNKKFLKGWLTRVETNPFGIKISLETQTTRPKGI